MGDIAHQLGLGEETQWGTAVTVDRFVEFTAETLERRQQIAASNGIRSGRRYGGQGRRITRQDAGGSVTVEVATTGFGVFYEYLLGAVSTVTVVTSEVFAHTITPGSLTGKSLTLQKGVQKPDGTVQAFTYPGSKVVAADFSIAQDGLLMCTFDIDSKQEVTSTALATASYSTPRVFTYSEGTLKVDDSEKGNVRSVGSLRIQNNLMTERYFLGNNGLKSEPINVPFDSLTGSLDVEFQNTTDFYDLFAGDTAAELTLEFVGDVITGTWTEVLRITLADVRFEGETPKVGGPELVFQNVPFVGLDSSGGGDDALSIFYRTSDSTP